jgi:NADH-quinone oxidoreductase subunit E
VQNSKQTCKEHFFIVCFESPVLCTGSQKETLALSCFLCLTRTGKTKPPVSRVVVYLLFERESLFRMKNKEVNVILSKYKRDQSSIIAILQDIQEQKRYLPRDVLEYVSEKLDIPLSKLYHLSTFYKAFSLEPRGTHLINVCLGTACHVRGAARLVDRLEGDLGISTGGTTSDHHFSLETVNCLGACALGPVVVVDDEYHGQMKPEEVDNLLKKYRKKPKRKVKASAKSAKTGKVKKVTKKTKKVKKKRGR